MLANKNELTEMPTFFSQARQITPHIHRHLRAYSKSRGSFNTPPYRPSSKHLSGLKKMLHILDYQGIDAILIIAWNSRTDISIIFVDMSLKRKPSNSRPVQYYSPYVAYGNVQLRQLSARRICFRVVTIIFLFCVFSVRSALVRSSLPLVVLLP